MASLTEKILDYFLAYLSQADGLSSLAAAGQIRAVSDQADPKAGEASIAVDVTDRGSHLGLPGRVLVDAEVSVTLRTSLVADEDLALFHALLAAASSALNALRTDQPENGFTILCFSPWVNSDVAHDGFYRYVTATSQLLLHCTA